MADKSLIYINGDSYSVLTRHKVYSDFLNDSFDCDVVNDAHYGSSNERIFRSTVTSLEKYKKQYDKIFVIVGFSFIARCEMSIMTDVFDKNINEDLIVREARKSTEKEGIDVDYTFTVTSEWARKTNISDVKERYKYMLMAQDPFCYHISFINQLAMFSTYLKSITPDYFLFQAAYNKHMAEDDEHLNLFQEQMGAYSIIQNDPNNRFYDFKLRDYCEENNIETAEMGHMYENGHKIFSEYLGKILTRSQWT